MINMVIFDMDGVLVDSELAIATSSQEALREWGVTAQIADFKEFTGMGDDKFIGGVSEKYGVPYDLKMKARAYEIYMETAEERVHVFPWSRPLMERLHSEGMKLAVASASDRVKVMRNIACIGVSPSLFEAIVTGSDVVRKKPFPDIFLKAFDMVRAACPETAADLDVTRTLVCEDALSGVCAARAAGMYCAAVTTSFDADALRKAGAHRITDDLLDVSRIVRELCGQKIL